MFMVMWLICAVAPISTLIFAVRRLWLESYVKHLPKVPLAVLMPAIQLCNKKSQSEMFQIVEKVLYAHDGLATFWIGLELAIVCDDPENTKIILTSKHCVHKPFFYRMMSAGGDGLFTSAGHIWRLDRKGIGEGLSPGVLKLFEPIFNRHFTDFAKSLQKNIDQPEFDLKHNMFLCNLNLICDTNLQYDVGDQGERIVDYISKLWEIATDRAASFLWQPTFMYRFSHLYAEEKKLRRYLFQFAPKMLANHQSIETNDGRPNDGNIPKSALVIDKVIEMEKMGILDRKRTLDHINTFVVAGTETSSLAILNSLLLLAMHQSVQDRLYEEICANVPNHDYIDYNTLLNLNYLDRVMKESLRMLPLGHIMLRETEAEIQLSNCRVPRGTILILSALKMHRSEKYWGPTANQFDPDRFLPELATQRHPYCYLPFSAGPRNCVGYKYAIYGFKLLLCHLMLRYKFTTSIKMDDLVFRNEFLLKLENKYLFQLVERHRV